MALLLSQLPTYQVRAPYYAVRIDVTWNNSWTQNLLQTTLAPTPVQVRAPLYSPPQQLPPLGPTWAWTFPQTLQVAGLPPGEQVYALPPSGPQQPTQVWVWSYNLNLIGQDQLPTGEQSTALPPKDYPEPATRTWTWWYNLNLIGQDKLPTGKQTYDLPPRGPEQPLRSWTWSYNLNLIGQDRLPAGEQSTALPQGYDYTPYRSWTFSYNRNLVGKDVLPTGEQSTALSPTGFDYTPYRSWTWWYNLNLIAQDQFPPGRQVYDLSPIAQYYPDHLRTWIDGFNPNLLIPQAPFRQLDWPLPQAPLQPLFGWTFSYNLNLIGQDTLPPGKQSTALTQSAEYPNALRTWIQNLRENTLQPLPYGAQIYALPPMGYDYTPPRSWVWSYNLNLIGQDVLPTGKQVYDLPPTGYIYPTENRTWIQNLNLALIVQAATLPFNQYDWPNPKIPQQPTQIWTSSYNQNLIGKDVLPTGKQVYDLPPQAQVYYNQNRTWIQSLNLALKVRTTPFNQTDWPTPKDYQQPLRSWMWSYNQNLIAKDQLPVGDQSTALPPIAIPYYEPNRGWINFISRALAAPPPPLPFNQYDWPLPQIAAQPDRTWAFRSQFIPVVGPPVPPGPPTSIFRPYVRDWWDSDEWGNIYPGSGIRRG